MYRTRVMFCLILLAIYQGANADFCSDYEEKEIDLLERAAECCKNIHSDDHTENEDCINEDDKCQEATCMLESEGILEDGTINEAAAIAKEMMGKSKKLWSSVITKASSQCLSMASKSDCPAMVYKPCICGMAFVQCPKTEFTNSKECKDAKKYVKTCMLRM